MKVEDLYKIDMLAFNSKIGYITNIGTTFYEMQSQYEEDSKEYQEINNRLKLCCTNQNLQIDAAKGLKIKEFPKHWTKYQKILETDSEEEKNRKEFENKLVIDKRPEFMKFLYTHYDKEYKNFVNNFDLYCFIKYGKKIKDLTEKDKNEKGVMEMLKYYEYKNPLLETNGVMNRLCRYMQTQLKDINKIPKKSDTEKIFVKIYNEKIDLDNNKLEMIKLKYKNYLDFKKTKQLKTSEFNNYEQYYKFLRNQCLEQISSDIKELANLSVYLCYKLYPNKSKDFCWDVFGLGILENLKEKYNTVKIPHISEHGPIEYLGENFEMVDISIDFKQEDIIYDENNDYNLNNLFSVIYDEDF